MIKLLKHVLPQPAAGSVRGSPLAVEVTVVILLGFGLVFLVAALNDYDWFFQMERTKRAVRWLGSRHRARVLYAVLGFTMTAGVIALYFAGASLVM